MLVARVYAVLDMLVVEVSHVDIGDGGGNHLVWREEFRGTRFSDSQDSMLTALSLSAHSARSFV